ncbi:fatty acid desaturase [Robbsia betulipollinis]|uniref:fatty acid desaturase n=1 Tax=Robbsia betulipollinis TaxID=2981849 RepID=UPI0032C46A45
MADYFDPMHQAAVGRMRRGLTARTEWPTWALVLVIYGGWLGTMTALHRHALPPWLATPLLIVLTVWYLSLQHELLHGHPTRSVIFNKMLGFAPLAVWYPYTLYRDSHLRHHRDEDLTMPGIDPETNYVHPDTWRAMRRWRRALWHARKTFLGRLLLGAPLAVAAMACDALRALRRGELHYLPMWLTHLAAVGALLCWVARYTGLPAWHYPLLVAWPALALAMVRSFYEHRAAPGAASRIAINEAGLFMRLLYLNNNYHLVHHDLPALAWYQLPTVYRMRRSAYIEKTAGFWIEGGYWSLFRRYALRQIDGPVHPFVVCTDGAEPGSTGR